MTHAAPPPAPAVSADRIRLTDAVFVSDLHLSEARPATVARFLRFMREEAARHRALLILGDLFEYWVGDDAGDPLGATVCAALRAYADAGGRLFLMHGNRDLLLGQDFCARSGATLLADPTLADIAGTAALLSHGDAWCTRDTSYMRYRARARNPRIQRIFLALPLPLRRLLVGRARRASEAAKRGKPPEIMDVTEAEIERTLRAAGVRTLIHGHTHRPAVHRFSVAGESAQRWVLPDWEFDEPPSRGGFLLTDDQGWRFEALDPAAAMRHHDATP